MEQEKTKSFRMSKNGTFKLNETELKHQIDNYNTLSITQSYRGISSLLILFAIVITAILYFVKFVDLSAIIAAVIIYLPLAYFVYRGKKWALIGAMLIWTLDKGFQLITAPNILVIIWWIAFMTYFYKAYKVEVERAKLNT